MKSNRIFFNITSKDVKYVIQKNRNKEISHFLVLPKKKSHWVSYNELEHIDLGGIRRMIIVFAYDNPVFVRPRFNDEKPVIIGQKSKR